ncbi:MAG: alternative ribosome rescue aminoacyl-tRNA hydrolase ArfB [Gemmatimonadaceae bacterium]
MTPREIWDEAGHLVVNTRLSIPPGELTVKASRAGGPGGQHVNTSSTRVEVAWDARHSTAPSLADRARIEEKLATRLDSRGVIRVTAADTRSQAQNRALAFERLARLVRDALVVPRVRRATKPTRASKERRLETKKRRSSTKRDRRRPGGSDD